MKTTIGQILINEALPDDMRDYNRVLDKGSISDLLGEVVERHGDDYRTISKKLLDVGHDAAFTTGGYSFGLSDLTPTVAALRMRERMREGMQKIHGDSALSDDDRDSQIVDLASKQQQQVMDEVYAEARAAQHPLAMQAVSGARGSKVNVNSLLGADLLYVDHRDRPIPVPVTRNYAQGLTPVEYFAGSFGARKGVLDLKCLAAGTRVRMADGSEKEIQDIAAGESVLGATMAGQVLPVTVLARHDNGPQVVGIYDFQHARSHIAGVRLHLRLMCTPAHKILCQPDTAAVCEKLPIGELPDNWSAMWYTSTCKTAQPVSLTSMCYLCATGPMIRPTFDLEVDHPDHLFVLANGIIVSNSATQDAGYLAKQMSQVSHRLIVSAIDAATEDDYDGPPRGMPTQVDDPDNEGALLAHPAGGYNRNTELTPRILKDLRTQGIKDILVRSVTVGGPSDGGVYARDAGRRERGGLSPVGDMIGLAGAQALAEPVTQSAISSKHSGGIAGASAGAIAGFAAIDQLVQVPKTFRGGATHAKQDGKISHIEPAPQGGHVVTINGKPHYVPHSLDVTVKIGDEIEAGDVLSTGVPNPAAIVQYKGLGEGRRYFVDAMRSTLKGANVNAHRRNIELLSRGLINHVRLTDELGDWSPDDVVPYQTLEANWRPREGTSDRGLKQSVGTYLEQPVLHYTIGTKIQPSMLLKMQAYGVKTLRTHADPPPFQPEMIRGMQNLHYDQDWMSRMIGSYQKSSLLDAVHRGRESDEAGTSYVPALARGENFGQQGLTKGWKSGGDPSVLDSAD